MGAIQWSPLQLAAGVELHGEVQLSAFGIGLGHHRRRADRGHRPIAVVGVRLAVGRARPALAAAQRRRHGVAVVGRQRPAAAGAARASTVERDARRSRRQRPLRAARPPRPAPRSTPSPRPTRSSTTRTTGRDPRPAAPGLLGREVPHYRTSRRIRRSCSPTSTRARSTLRGARSAGQPLCAQLRSPGRGPGRIRQLGDARPQSWSSSSPPTVAGRRRHVQHQPPAAGRAVVHPATRWCRSRCTSTATPARPRRGSSSPPRRSRRAGGATPRPLPLVGSWVAPDPTKNTPVAGTALKLTPYTVLPGEDYAASWGGAGGTFGTSFTDQGLQFTAGAGRRRRPPSPRPARESPRGCVSRCRPRSSTVTITLPLARSCSPALVGVVVEGGESPYGARRGHERRHSLWTPTGGGPDATGVYTLSLLGAPVSEIDLAVGPGRVPDGPRLEHARHRHADPSRRRPGCTR